MSLNPIIQSHLLLKLTKHPKLKHQTLPPAITTLLTPSDVPSTSESQLLRSKVENRLCSSKIVAEAIKTVVAWTVGEEGAKLVKGKPKGGTASTAAQPTSKKGPQAARPAEADEESSEGDEQQSDGEDQDGRPRNVVVGSDEESDDEFAQEDVAADEAGWESGSIDGADEGPSRLAPASSDDEASDDESGSNSETSSLAVPTKKAKTAAGKQTTSTTKSATAKPGKAVTSSTFLPSLSTGFIMGDSDSDPDLDPDVDGAGVVGRKGAERKNRRGQRARQA